jgi:hypothetical protein
MINMIKSLKITAEDAEENHGEEVKAFRLWLGLNPKKKKLIQVSSVFPALRPLR